MRKLQAVMEKRKVKLSFTENIHRHLNLFPEEPCVCSQLGKGIYVYKWTFHGILSIFFFNKACECIA